MEPRQPPLSRKTKHRTVPQLIWKKMLGEFEDIKEIIRIRKSKKNRQHNGQKKKYKRTNNNLQNVHVKLKIE